MWEKLCREYFVHTAPFLYDRIANPVRMITEQSTREGTSVAESGSESGSTCFWASDPDPLVRSMDPDPALDPDPDPDPDPSIIKQI